VRPSLLADVPAAQQSETALSGVQNARHLDETELFGTVGKAAQLLGAAHRPHTDQHLLAGAPDQHLIACLLTTAEAA